MTDYCWRHFQITLPDDWEMLRYGRQLSRGRCEFADRYQMRLEMNWRAVPGTPDFTRMLSDYMAKLVKNGQAEAAETEPVQLDGWQGLVTRAHGLTVTRVGRYFAGEGCLNELVLLWTGARDAALERRIIHSVAEVPARADGLRRWRAFGMDLLVEDDLPLHACTIEPGRAKMVFRPDEHGRRESRFERIGMVAHWLHRPLDAWLRHRVPSEVVARETASTEVRGHQIATIIGDRAGHGVRRLLGKRDRYFAEAWICPVDGRVYCHTAKMVRAAEELPSPRRLTCCEGMT